MSFTMIGYFQKYGGWQMNVINTCQKFYNQFGRYPNYIQMNDKTLDFLFDEDKEAFLDPYSEEHAVRDSRGTLLLPLEKNEDQTYEIPKNISCSDKEFLENYLEQNKNIDEEETEFDFGIEEEEDIYPQIFGVNDDYTVSFVTNKFELMFLEGNELEDDYYIVHFGSGPSGGGEEFEEEEIEEIKQNILLVA